MGRRAFTSRTTFSTAMRERPSFRAALRDMLRARLVLMLFVTSLLTPRIDVAAFLRERYGAGPQAVGDIKAIESVAVVLIPLTPWRCATMTRVVA